jgi:hypothetical protein
MTPKGFDRERYRLTDPVRAMPSARAGREPSLATRLGPDGRPSLSRLVPTFTCRTHKAPVPRGHRTYIGKQEWR